MINVVQAGFSELADYARDRSRSLGCWAAAVEIADLWGGQTRRFTVVAKKSIRRLTQGYEVVLRARTYRDGALISVEDPNRN